MVPAYNPGRIIIDVVGKALPHVAQVVIVDDGCDEAERAYLRQCLTNEKVRLLAHDFNRGKGVALHTGISHCLAGMQEGDFILTMDGDGQHDPEDIPKFKQLLAQEGEVHFALGERFEDSAMPAKSRIGASLARWLFRALFSSKVHDTQTGFRLLSAAFAKSFVARVKPGRYETEMDMLILASHTMPAIHSVEIRTIYLDGNKNTKYRAFADSYSIAKTFIKYINFGLSNLRFSPRAVGRRLAIYASAALAGTALFIWLHHLGNQIPYELAQQRFAEAFEEVAQPGGAERYFQGKRPLFAWEFCEISVAVLAGAHPDGRSSPLAAAVLPKSFQWKRRGGDPLHCSTLQRATDGQEVAPNVMKTRYWWGNKAFFAIALHRLSVWEAHQFILFATYGAWLLLAIAMALLGWRALLVASPTILFGMTLSGIPRFADIANGPATLWTVLAASALALLLRWPRTARWAPLFCFGTGMTCAFLYQSDGHNSLAIALIGLVAWLGHERAAAGGERRRAFRCILLAIAGFFVCIALGQVAKSALVQWQGGNSSYIALNVPRTVSGRLDQAIRETLTPLTQGETAWIQSCAGCGEEGWQKLPIVRNFLGLVLLTPFRQEVHTLLNVFSALALAGAVGGAVWQAWRGRRKLANDILWLIALALLASTQFFFPNDIFFRSDRFVFLLLATCWSCLAIAALQLRRKFFSLLTGCLAGGLLISVVSFERTASYWLDRTIAKAHLVVRAEFDVYDDQDRLIYLKENCNDADIEPWFFLHLFPVDHADLPEHRQMHSFDNLDFHFEKYGSRYGERCAAMRPLPDYEIDRLATGQYFFGTDPIWVSKFSLRSR